MRLLLPITLAIIAAGAPEARAQWAFPHEQPWVMDVSRPAVDRMKDMVELSEAQQVVLDAFYDEFVSQFQAFVAEGRAEDERLAAYRTLVKGSVEYHNGMLEHHREMAEWADRQADLNRELLDDLRNIISEEQSPDFEKWIRWNFRRHQLRYGHYTEEAIDIIALLEQLELAAESSFDAEQFDLTLAGYETAIHRAITERRATAVKNARHRWREIFENTWTKDGKAFVVNLDEDPAARMEERRRAREKKRDLHLWIRSINRTTLAQVKALLPPIDALRLDEAYENSRMPGLMSARHQRAALYLERLLASDVLSEAQQIAIEDIRRQYESRIRIADKNVRDTEDELAEVTFAFGIDARDEHKQAKNDVEIVQRDRREFVDETCLRAFRILEPPQQEAFPLPERPASGR